MEDKLAKNIADSLASGDFTPIEGDSELIKQINRLFSRMQEKSSLEEKLNELALKTIDNNHLIHLMCHDLRNPLGTTISFLELSAEEAQDLNIEIPFLEEMQVGLEFSLKVIENVQSLMAINSGKLKIDLEYVNLKEIIDESVSMIQTRFKDKSVKIVATIPSELNVLTHKTYAVLSVFNNLLSNAVKFSPEEGSVEIIAAKEQQMVVCKVIDHGIGMPKEILDNIFTLDKPTNRTGTSGEQGTGFGMTLVKRFMEAFEGQLYIESIEGGESTGTTAILQFWSKP